MKFVSHGRTCNATNGVHLVRRDSSEMDESVLETCLVQAYLSQRNLKSVLIASSSLHDKFYFAAFACLHAIHPHPAIFSQQCIRSLAPIYDFGEWVLW